MTKNEIANFKNCAILPAVKKEVRVSQDELETLRRQVISALRLVDRLLGKTTVERLKL